MLSGSRNESNDKENKMILCIMKDITKERKHKDQIHNAQIELRVWQISW